MLGIVWSIFPAGDIERGYWTTCLILLDTLLWLHGQLVSVFWRYVSLLTCNQENYFQKFCLTICISVLQPMMRLESFRNGSYFYITFQNSHYKSITLHSNSVIVKNLQLFIFIYIRTLVISIINIIHILDMFPSDRIFTLKLIFNSCTNFYFINQGTSNLEISIW